MTTDDKNNNEVEQKTDNESIQEDNNTSEQPFDKNKELSSSEQAIIDRMTSIFTEKVNEITDKYDKKVDELSKQINDKDVEIAKLRKVNSEILMNTDLSGGNKGVIDYNSVEFDDVDWEPGAKALLDDIDKKLA